jgi:hypothetical protein
MAGSDGQCVSRPLDRSCPDPNLVLMRWHTEPDEDVRSCSRVSNTRSNFESLVSRFGAQAVAVVINRCSNGSGGGGVERSVCTQTDLESKADRDTPGKSDGYREVNGLQSTRHRGQ